MNQRVKKVILSLSKNKIDAFLVLKDINVRYLTEIPSEESFLLICKKKTFYITDSRYYLKAKNSLKDITVKCIKKSLQDEILDIVLSQKIRSLGINEAHISVAKYKVLKAELRGSAKLVGITNLIESLRSIKEDTEVSHIRKALSIHKEAFKFLKKTIKPGLREQDILKELEGFIRSKGVIFSFDPIIASGMNSCFPHAKVTNKKIKANDIVLVDMGIDFKGYKSDLTRMFFLGRISKSIREINNIVYQAQQEAIKEIKAGVEAHYIDKVARDYFAKHGIAKYFNHALGHGVGMEVHEMPRLSAQNKCRLEEGMVITVEPAVYFPNKFGIRLEEMVLVKKQGCELLSDNIN